MKKMLFVLAIVIGSFSSLEGADACPLDAGPIWNNAHAQTVCPNVCSNQSGNWDGNWWTTIWGQMSVCSCFWDAVVEAGPIWSNVHAQTVCPGVCDGVDGDWNGQWWTTTWGQMSVCACTNIYDTIRTKQAIEAGPLWNNDHAQNACPSVCTDAGGNWNGQWWTTIPNEMSVCECENFVCE